MNISYLKDNDIDVDESIRLLGDLELYNELLNDFVNASNDRLLNLKDYLEVEDLNNYAIVSHSIKSDSKYLGFKKLAQISYEHEMSGKNNNISFIKDNYEYFISEINNVLDIVKEYLKGR